MVSGQKWKGPVIPTPGSTWGRPTAKKSIFHSHSQSKTATVHVLWQRYAPFVTIKPMSVIDVPLWLQVFLTDNHQPWLQYCHWMPYETRSWRPEKRLAETSAWTRKCWMNRPSPCDLYTQFSHLRLALTLAFIKAMAVFFSTKNRKIRISLTAETPNSQIILIHKHSNTIQPNPPFRLKTKTLFSLLITNLSKKI